MNDPLQKAPDADEAQVERSAARRLPTMDELRQDLRIRAPAVAVPGDMAVEPPRRQDVGVRDVVVQGQPDLLQIDDALDAQGRLARRLDRGQQQGDQHRNNRDDNQQLNQGEGWTGPRFS